MAGPLPTVAVVIPCYRQAHFLRNAIDSALAQSIPPAQVIVVDDGSDDNTSEVAFEYERVTLIRQENRGLSNARNTGLQAASSEKIIFLDADDILLPKAIAAGVSCFRQHPEAAFVYGAFREICGTSRPRKFCAVTSHIDFVRCNWIGCPATVMYDRSKLLEQGGFDESLGMTEDWDIYLRLSRHYPFASHNTLVAHYVKHDANMSNSVTELKGWIEVVRGREWERGLDEEGQRAWREGLQIWRNAFDPRPEPKRSILMRAFRKAARFAAVTRQK
jgi:glycosyltransferase involved in cell wall biosynthesis